MSEPRETTDLGDRRNPRFFIWKDGAGRWTWGYKKAFEHAPAGVKLYFHTRLEAEEVISRLVREDELAADPKTQGDLFAAGGR